MAKSERVLSAFERAVARAIGDGKDLGSESDPARENWPSLWAWLSTIYVGRESIKNPAHLTIRLGPNGVLASLVDRDLCTSIDVSCSQLCEVFAAVEAALTSASPALKSWGRKEPHLRKRRAGS